MRNGPRKHPFVGIGFAVFTLLSPIVFLIGLFGSVRTGIEWGSWSAAIGVCMIQLGYLFSGEFFKGLPSFLAGAMFPAIGFTYVHAHGYAWAWVWGWWVLGLAVTMGVYQLVASRPPRSLSFEHARRILNRADEIPLVPRMMMSLLQWTATISLGTFLVLANLGYQGYLATAPLGVFGAMTLLYFIMFLRFRRYLMPQ